MSRLTKDGGIEEYEIIRCLDCSIETAGEDLEYCGFCQHWQDIIDKLAAYEDLGEPHELMKRTEVEGGQQGNDEE